LGQLAIYPFQGRDEAPLALDTRRFQTNLSR